MKKFTPRSIFGLALATSLIFALTSILVGLAVYAIAHEALEVQVNHRIEAETNALLHEFESEGMPALITVIEQRDAGRQVMGMGYLLVDARGERLAGALKAAAPEPGWREFLYTLDAAGDHEISQALTTKLPDGARLVIAADRTPIDEIDGTMFKLFLGAFSIMLLVGAGSAWALSGIVWVRLDRINATAKAIIGGDLARRVPRDGTSSEFDRLSETLNRMLDRNAELLENLKQVSSDIAHDLRTPMARLQQALDGALSENLDAEGYRRAIKSAADRASEMLDLFSALLRISEIETFQIRENFQSVNLSEITERVVDAFGPDIEAAGCILAANVAPGVVFAGDRHLLSQMLVNLIENALRHTPTGSTLTIDLKQDKTATTLVVADNGRGIEAQHRDLVLRRFARLERSRSTPGHGLGLSLVAAIVDAHFGNLVLSDNNPGLRATICFPSKASMPYPAAI